MPPFASASPRSAAVTVITPVPSGGMFAGAEPDSKCHQGFWPLGGGATSVLNVGFAGSATKPCALNADTWKG